MQDLRSTDFLLCPLCRMTFPPGTTACREHGQARSGDPLLGATLCGHTVVGLLGEGIYSTADPVDGAPLAVRILPAQLAAGFSLQDMLSALRTAYVASMETAVLPMDGGVLADGRYFYLFPWPHELRMEPLLHLLRRAPRPIGEAIEAAVTLCAALTGVRDAGLYPTDLLGESLLVAPPDRPLRVQFLDLGMGRRTAHGGLQPVDPHSYIHALGMLLHLLATGRPAAAGVPVSASLPPEFKVVVLRALEEAHRTRYADVRALHEDLLALQGGGPPGEPPPAPRPEKGPPAAPAPGHKGRRKLMAIGTALLLAGLVLGARASRLLTREAGQALHAPMLSPKPPAERRPAPPAQTPLSVRPRALAVIHAARRDGHSATRQEAARILGQSGDRTLRPQLEEMLLDEDARVARQAAWALGDLGDPAAVAALDKSMGNGKLHLAVGVSLLRLGEQQRGLALLQKVLHRESGDREQEAAFWLGEHGSPEAWGVLRRHLIQTRDGQPEKHLEILGRLCQGRDQAACQLLRERLDAIHGTAGAQGRLRLLAAAGLMRAGEVVGYRTLHQLAGDPTLRLPALGWLAGRDLTSEETLWLGNQLAGPSDGRDEPRAQAAEALGAAAAIEALPVLSAALTERSVKVRLAAAGAVLRMAVLEPISLAGLALDWAQTAIAAPSAQSRRAAALALGGMPPVMAMPLLLQAAGDPEFSVRSAALRALAQVDSPEAREVLNGRRRQGALLDRVAVAGVLLAHGDRGGASVLRQALESDDVKARLLAIDQAPRHPDPQERLGLLVLGLVDGDEHVRLHAAAALARLGDRRGRQVLRSHRGLLLADDLLTRDALQRLGDPVPPLELAAALGAAEQAQREAAMRVAPELLPETGRTLVLCGLCDPAPEVRLLAVEAVAELPLARRQQHLLLLQASTDADSTVRGRALTALSALLKEGHGAQLSWSRVLTGPVGVVQGEWPCDPPAPGPTDGSPTGSLL